MKPKILVVENEHILLEGIREVLEREQFEVITAQNGHDGLNVLGKQDYLPDLILSDIMMPGMDGHTFLKEVRKNRQWVHIPFIFLTAKTERQDVNMGRMLGADDYLTKPFMSEELVLAVQAKIKRSNELKDRATHDIREVKTQIMTILNHELRTPLTYVTGFSDLLKITADEITTMELRSLLDRIDNGAQRLRRLIEDFILLVELQTDPDVNAFELNAIIRDYGKLINRLSKDYRELAAKQSIDFHLNIDAQTPAVKVNKDYFAKIIEALLDNAVKFTNQGGVIAVHVYPFEDQKKKLYACFQVVDNGVGITDEALPRIFEPFFQATRHENEHPGTGSGLTIARGLAELHGGTIKVSSRVNEGSTFTVFIPAADV